MAGDPCTSVGGVLRRAGGGRRRPGADADLPRAVRPRRDAAQRSGGSASNGVAARDRLDRLTERVLHDGRPYTADRIRLVAEERTDPEAAATAQPWPAAVAVPPVVDSQLGVRTADLADAAAAAAAQALPHHGQQGGAWQVRRTSDGKLLAVSWRYLLPDE